MCQLPAEMACCTAARGGRCACTTPAGSDPTKLIEELAKKRKQKVLGVSMG